jgi:hypothetical protein
VPLIPELRRLREEDLGFKAILGYIVHGQPEPSERKKKKEHPINRQIESWHSHIESTEDRCNVT